RAPIWHYPDTARTLRTRSGAPHPTTAILLGTGSDWKPSVTSHPRSCIRGQQISSTSRDIASAPARDRGPSHIGIEGCPELAPQLQIVDLLGIHCLKRISGIGPPHRSLA